MSEKQGGWWAHMWRPKPTQEIPVEDDISYEEMVGEKSEILQEYNGWNLCGTSEGRLEESLSKGAAIVINDSLVLKFVGKMSALCIKDMNIGDAHFKRGYWYSPLGNIRDYLKNDFFAGERQVSYSYGQWVQMRKINGQSVDEYRTFTDERSPSEVVEREEALIQQATRYASLKETALPESIDGKDRQDFQEDESEDEPMIYDDGEAEETPN